MPKVVDIAAKRAAFVAASLDVIASEGLAAATLRRIAAQAGVTTGSVTHYFAGRDALLLEAVAAAHLAAGGRMQAAMARADTPRTRLEAVVFESLPLDAVRLREWKVWTAFRGVLVGDRPLSALNEMAYGAWRGLLARLLEPLCGEAEAARREAALLQALVDGFGFRMAVVQSAEALAAEQSQVAGDVRAYLARFGEQQPGGG